MLVSALIADGPPSRLIEEAIDRRIELVVPDLVLAELERVLTLKLGLGEALAREALATVADAASERPRAPRRAPAITGDRADDRILGCAVAERVDILASGDRRHLLPLQEHAGVRILTPQALLAELAGGPAG